MRPSDRFFLQILLGAKYPQTSFALKDLRAVCPPVTTEFLVPLFRSSTTTWTSFHLAQVPPDRLITVTGRLREKLAVKNLVLLAHREFQRELKVSLYSFPRFGSGIR